VYGSVRTVVWQGSVGDHRPYADLTGNPEVIASFVGLVPLNAQIGHKGAIGKILFGAATGGRADG